MQNLYTLIGVLPTASTDEIKDAYSRASAKLIISGLPEDEVSVQLSELEKAYAVLSDSGERTNYDRSIASVANLASPTALTLLERPATIMRPESPTPLIQQLCPNCGATNPVQASMCGQCGQQISRPCPSCGQSVLLSQPVCPRCNIFLPEYDQRRVAHAVIADQKIQSERRESESNVRALEAVHRVRAAQGMVFWVLVSLACVALTVIPVVIFYYVSNQP